MKTNWRGINIKLIHEDQFVKLMILIGDPDQIWSRDEWDLIYVDIIGSFISW